MLEASISVIVPFYNARDYVTQAVESALDQSETGEVLLIEDGSPDGGPAVCEYLSKTYDKVHLLRHPGGGNRGAAASRNLGIVNAKYPYIAFLDADDYYLSNRFKRAGEIFQSNESVDGVYEAIGTYFQDQEAQKVFLNTELPLLTTVKEADINPDDLFIRLMKGGIGKIHLDGLTIKSSVLSLTGYFNEQLEVHQDIDLIYKISAMVRLFPGILSEPVAIRRVHDKNRITYHMINRRKNYRSMVKFWQQLSEWADIELSGQKLKWIVRRTFGQLRRIDEVEDCSLLEFMASRKRMFDLATKYPWILADAYCWRRVIPSRSMFNKFKV